jgi:hypothetical protein
LSDLLAVKKLSLSTVTLILHSLESLLQADILPGQESLVLSEYIDFSAETLSSPLDFTLDVSGFLKLLLEDLAARFERPVINLEIPHLIVNLLM